MKKILIATVIQFRVWMVILLTLGAFVLIMGMPIPAHAQTASATLAWDAPTHLAGGTPEAPECGANGAALTPEQIATLGYTFSYREKGTATWSNLGGDSTKNRVVTITGLSYNTTYEASVGAHWPGKDVVCATDILEFPTGDAPAPGACTGLKRIPTP